MMTFAYRQTMQLHRGAYVSTDQYCQRETPEQKIVVFLQSIYFESTSESTDSMTDQTKIAVVVIIGVGKREQDEYDSQGIQPIQDALPQHVTDGVIFELVHWTDILQSEKERLRTGYNQADDKLSYEPLRRFFSGLITDVIAYQPQGEDSYTYLEIHKRVAKSMDRLAHRAGKAALLVVIAHSLGGVITSNYMRELQDETYQEGLVPEEIHYLAGDTPLERGETLTQVYTMGTPLALYSVRHQDFDEPMQVPSPQLTEHYPIDEYGELPSQWLNFYNRNDVLAYPLAFLNDSYAGLVEDHPVGVGDWQTSWNPFSHMAYWGDEEIVRPIAKGITALYDAVNGSS